MPVVLTTAPGERRSGHTYDDRTGIAYEFPAGRYERWIATGEQFLYYVPRYGYTGTGLIGRVTPSTATDRLVAEILDYEPLPVVVPIRSVSGDYYEADTTFWKSGNVYWAQGVRPLGAARFAEILRDAGLGNREQLHTNASPPGPYPPHELATAVERYSVEVAMAQLRDEFSHYEIVEMPRNNPGFDIRVGPPANPTVYVEVKGTQTAEPVFFLSEGEREFSVSNSARYILFVVAGIDLSAHSHGTVHRRAGAIDDTIALLKPTQWRGHLTLGLEGANERDPASMHTQG